MNTSHELSALSELVLSLSTLALHYLGEPVITNQADNNANDGDNTSAHTSESNHNNDDNPSSQNLEMAKQNIEFIEVISEKTKGNLTPAERQLIDMVLSDLQDRYQLATTQAQ